MAPQLTPRRAFFRLSLDEAIAAFDDVRGRPSFRLSDLPSLDDGRMAALVPAVADASGITVEDGRFVVSRPGSPSRVLFAAGSRDEEVWSRMDGRATIGEVADALALEWAQPENEVFADVRRVFLTLVACGICLPCNPLR